MEYLMPAAFLAVAFFLGAFITNFFKARKIDVLEHELSELQTKFYDQQNTSKKQLGEQEVIIKQLKKNLKNITAPPTAENSSPDQSKELKTLNDKNSVLEKELKGIKAKYRELKVEKAVKKVEKKYPMQLYGMDGDRSIDLNAKRKEKEAVKPQKLKTEKVKSKITIAKKNSPTESEESDKLSIKGVKPKSKKSKKKSKSKKGKSKKVLALFVSGKKGKKKKKSSKSKKKKSKSK